ncbi:MAG: hypothetical protein JWQ87_90 [Candidatus Sulfotelmatobacter sp.]|nr:hypothetical protein [Candidatus Sulfotelmatobacter sp.]
MATAVKPDRPVEDSRGPAAVVRMPAFDRPRAAHALEEYGKRASHVLSTTKQAASKIYDEARARAVVGYAKVSHGTRDLTSRAWNRAQWTKQEHPLRVLAAVATIAFAAGIALRIWRSRNL